VFIKHSGKKLYLSIEEKAANLLYLTIKNHSFVDGNKRIAASLFLWYLQKNNYLYNISGEKRIADNALVAVYLMIAQSNPKEKDIQPLCGCIYFLSFSTIIIRPLRGQNNYLSLLSSSSTENLTV